MQTKYFKYIKEIEYQGSITKAANKLFLSQQALSKILENIENELGFYIFERSKKGVIPTQKGERFLSDLSAIINIMSKWEQQEKEKYKINILLQYILKDLALDELFNQCINSTGAVDIEYDVMTPPEIVKRISSGENCWGIFIASPQAKIFPELQKVTMSPEIRAEIVGNEESTKMCVLLQHDDALVKKEIIKLSDLQEKLFITNKGILNNRAVQILSSNTVFKPIILPRSVNAIDYITQHDNSFTCSPGFIAHNNIHVRSGVIVPRQLADNLDEGIQCYLLYRINQMIDMQKVIQNMRVFFTKS